MFKRTVTSWEYKVVEGDMMKDVYEQLLNDLGREGWDAIHIHRILGEPTSITFKRIRGQTEL